MAERFLADQRGAACCQVAFLLLGILAKQYIADCKLQHRVTQELQPLVIGFFFGGRVSKGKAEQGFVLKAILQRSLQRAHGQSLLWTRVTRRYL